MTGAANFRAPYVKTDEAFKAIKGREGDLVRALGISGRDRTSWHMHCPYPDHEDKNPSWRLLDDGKVICSCRDGREHSLFDAITYMRSVDFDQAKIVAMQLLGREDLIIDPSAKAKAAPREEPHDPEDPLRPPDDKAAAAGDESAAGDEPAAGLTLPQLAQAKGLTVEYLQDLGLSDSSYKIDGRNVDAVKIPYCGEDDTVAEVRYRVALTGDKFRWQKGAKAIPYGLDQVKHFAARGRAIIVEGETDTWTCWLHKFPAIGLPGWGGWSDERDAKLFDGVPIVYAVIEPDQGGESLLRRLAKSRIRDRLRLVRLPAGIKDPNALYLANPAGFTEAFQAALDAAVPFAPSDDTKKEEDQQEDDEEKQEPFVFFNPTELQGRPVPPQQWLVPDWIPMRRATSLYGDGGLGKTLLAQMLATSCALGALWLGLPVLRCKSILLFAESDLDEMWQTQDRINDLYGCTFADLGDMIWLPRLGHGNDLMRFSKKGVPEPTPLLDQLVKHAQNAGARLVITDTLADVFNGNENDRAQSRRFGQEALGYIAREINGASLTLAHPSLTGLSNGSTGSGSTAWKGTFRSQLYLTEPDVESGDEPDPDVRTLTRVKSNRARRGDTIEIKWKNGVFVPVNAPLSAGTGFVASVERRNAENVFLALLDKMTDEGRFVSSNSRGSNYAPKMFAGRPQYERQNFKKADFERAMERLFSDNKITIGSRKGEDRKKYSCIVRKEHPTDDLEAAEAAE